MTVPLKGPYSLVRGPAIHPFSFSIRVTNNIGVTCKPPASEAFVMIDVGEHFLIKISNVKLLTKSLHTQRDKKIF